MNQSQKNIFIAASIFMLVFLVFFNLAFHPNPIRFEIKKLKHAWSQKKYAELSSSASLKNHDSLTQNLPAIKYRCMESTQEENNRGLQETQAPCDGNPRILIIGDSQLEGLKKPLYKYYKEQGIHIAATVLWYGSSTQIWAQTDTLNFYLKKYQPSLVILALGLNELFLVDQDKIADNSRIILHNIYKSGARAFWIGPAAWKKDRGICSTLAVINGKDFFPSHLLKLDRAADKRHPSSQAAWLWFDQIKPWLPVLSNSFVSDTLKPYQGPLILLRQVAL